MSDQLLLSLTDNACFLAVKIVKYKCIWFCTFTYIYVKKTDVMILKGLRLLFCIYDSG